MSHDICWCGPKEPAHSNAGSVAAQGKSLGHVPAEQPKDSAHRPTSAPLSNDELTAKARSMIREYEAAAMANRALGSPVDLADLRATEQERVAAMLKALLAQIEHLQYRYVRMLERLLGEAEAMCCCSDDYTRRGRTAPDCQAHDFADLVRDALTGESRETEG